MGRLKVWKVNHFISYILGYTVKMQKVRKCNVAFYITPRIFWPLLSELEVSGKLSPSYPTSFSLPSLYSTCAYLIIRLA